ncbi:hypothetical protein D3C80_1272610 [compost metagenome]
MKQAVIGAHRVGKTTLVEKLQESLPEYKYYTEPYYALEEAGHIFSEVPTVDDYLMQLEYSINQLSSSDDNVVFDRCPIDILAYIMAVSKSGNVQPLYHKVQRAMQEIDLLVFVPIEKPDLIECKGFELPKLRYRVNEILIDLIEDFEVETIEVSGTLSDRQFQVITKMMMIEK